MTILFASFALLMTAREPTYVAVCERDETESVVVLVASIDDAGLPTPLARSFVNGDEEQPTPAARAHRAMLTRLGARLREARWHNEWGGELLDTEFAANPMVRETTSAAGRSIALRLGRCQVDDKAGTTALVYATAPVRRSSFAPLSDIPLDGSEGPFSVVRARRACDDPECMTSPRVIPAAMTRLSPTRYEARLPGSQRVLIVDETGRVVPCSGDCEGTADFLAAPEPWHILGSRPLLIAAPSANATARGFEPVGGYSGGLSLRIVVVGDDGAVHSAVASLVEIGC